MTRSVFPSVAPQVTVLAGGVGAARYLRGLVQVIPAEQIDVIVNTGDDLVLHGLSICPDIDTITYTLAGAIDTERGWGLTNETWVAMGALARYAEHRPVGSQAAPTWFNLGDQDLATHMYRTARLAEGASLALVTAEIARAWELTLRIHPMSEAPCATMIDAVTHGRISFQEYFVQHRHAIEVTGIELGGQDKALSAGAQSALTGNDLIVIAPSNPLVSIGPIRALTDVDSILAARREQVVAVSPIVGGAALKGPADQMMTALGHESSVVGIARIYAPVAGTLVIDEVDADLADQVRAEGMDCIVTPTVMSDPQIAADLARATLSIGS
jgi:LPPG:FO 2-phospho-L-lactate transferase